MRRLTDELRGCLDQPDAPIFIDQEGGRVQRLRPPHWRAAPPMKLFGDLYRYHPEDAKRALALNIGLIAAELRDVGISVDCAPLLDVANELTHDAIGDRAISNDAKTVAALGRVATDAFLDHGIFPVVKHMPGHGRATIDSHEGLPAVSASHADLTAVDFHPFREISDAPFGMTAHIVYEAVDPAAPATMSRTVISDIIRDEIGFDGLLISDDLSMHALTGSFRNRATDCLEAGCDLALHCNGDRDEMAAVVDGARPMSDSQWQKWQAAQQLRHETSFDRKAAQEELAVLLKGLV